MDLWSGTKLAWLPRAQKQGVDFTETFAPVIKMTSLRLLLALANENQAYLHQMDVKTAFLYGELDEEIFMDQPEGQAAPGEEHLVCKLKKSIYGLKQSPRQWNKRINQFLSSIGLRKMEDDHAVYTLDKDPNKLFIGVYVDDLIIGSKDMDLLDKVKAALSSEFEMKDLGDINYVLGIKVMQSASSIFLSQKTYIEDILQKFGMNECHGCASPMEREINFDDLDSPLCDEKIPYRAAIGSLMYLMTCTRPDLATSVSILSRYF